MERALIDYIANAFWQIPLLALGAWFLLRAIKATPLAHHCVWLVVLALAVLLPARGIQEAAAPLIPPHTGAAAGQLPLPSAGAEPGGLAASPAPPPQRRWPRLATQVHTVPIAPGVAHLVAGLYLAMALFGLVRIGFAWRAAQRLVAQSHPATLSPRHLEALRSYGHRMQASVPQLRESNTVSSPVVVGVRSPVLLLPPDFARHTEDEIAAALCHELAHLRRHDYFVNLLCQLAALPVAWHPAVHAMQRRIRRTRELVCDAIAAHQMCSEMKYAKCLVALAQSMLRGHALEKPAQALGLFGKDTLEERVMRLMEKKSVESLRVRMARVVAGATAMATAILLAAVIHVAPVMAASVLQSPEALTPLVQSPEEQSPEVQSPEVQSEAAPQPQNSPIAPASAATAPGDRAVDQTNVEQRKQSHPQREPQDDGTPMVNLGTGRCRLTPEQRQQVKRQVEDALKQLHGSEAALNDGDFKRQMDEGRRSLAEAQAMLNSPEFHKQIEDAARQAKKQAKEFALHNEELKKQMADLQKKLQSGEFQEQIAEARRQAADVALHSEDFKKQMEELKRLQRGELQRAMEKAAQELKDAEEQRKSEPVR